MRTALTIAGSDPSGGAGVQADLKTFAAFGVYGVSAITAVTAQNTLGITASLPLPADLVTAQIEAVAGDIELQATKIGMLATAAVVEAVAAAIEELDLPMVVLDPVLASTSGTALLDEDGIEAMRAELLPHALIVTPNAREAAVLSRTSRGNERNAHEAARRIHQLGAKIVIVTGGDIAAAESHEDIVDLLFDGREFTELHTPRIGGPQKHGTGCTFASAIAAGLARGDAPLAAVVGAQRYVAGAIRHATAFGHGRGPLNHFWGGILKA